RGHAFEDLSLSTRPDDLDAVGSLGAPQPEVQVGQGAGGVRGRHVELLRLGVAGGRDAHLGAEYGQMVRSDSRLDPDPGVAAAHDVLEETRWARDVHDEEIQIPVVVDVGDG